jgi:hypothetical protein
MRLKEPLDSSAEKKTIDSSVANDQMPKLLRLWFEAAQFDAATAQGTAIQSPSPDTWFPALNSPSEDERTSRIAARGNESAENWVVKGRNEIQKEIDIQGTSADHGFGVPSLALKNVVRPPTHITVYGGLACMRIPIKKLYIPKTNLLKAWHELRDAQVGCGLLVVW